MKLKQRVIDRRSSPIIRRKEQRVAASRRRPLAHGSTRAIFTRQNSTIGKCLSYELFFLFSLSVDSASTPESNSPPNGLPTSRSSSGSTPIHEEAEGPPGQAGSCSDLSHPFSSLPNISLGRPPHSTQNVCQFCYNEVLC